MSTPLRIVLVSLLAMGILVGAGTVPAAASHDDAACSFPIEETDATGTNVIIEEPPEEIVVLDAASAQTIWEIGAEDRVTGMPVREYTAYLEGSEDRTDVLTAEGTNVEVETVTALEPDLVIAPNPDFTPEETIDQLRDAGLTVIQLEFEESFEDIYAKTLFLGHIVGECEAADRTATETREEVETIRDAVDNEDRPRALYYFHEFTAGSGTFIADIIETAGAENVASEAGIDGFKPIQSETIVDTDPDWIVHPTTEGAFDPEAEPFPELNAVQEERIVAVDEDLIGQAGPRVVVPLRTMAEAFHPNAFESTPEPTPEPTPTPTPEPDDQDGLGVIVALAALGGVLVWRRVL